MLRYSVFLVTLTTILLHETLSDSQCGNHLSDSGKTIKLSVNSRKNKTGAWVDEFTARAEYHNSSESIIYDVTHTVDECDGKRIVTITGGTGGSFNVPKNVNGADRLTFHPRCGKNIAIINNGRTVQKININDPLNAVVFTNRPLKFNEIFEVRLDQRQNIHTHSLGIGIITSAPEVVDILPEMWKSREAWIWHHTSVIHNNKAMVTNYPKKNMSELQVGDKVGVMINEYGTLHFFINGEDQGPAASGIPLAVHGLFELWYNAVKATIVNPP